MFVIQRHVPQAAQKRVRVAMARIEAAGLLLPESYVLFTSAPGGPKTYDASYHRLQVMRDVTDRLRPRRVLVKAMILLTHGVLETSIVHEYGHHVDEVMSGADLDSKQDDAFWSNRMQRYTGSVNNRELFAEMFTVLAYKGSTYGHITVPAVPTGRQREFHEWFDASVRGFGRPLPVPSWESPWAEATSGRQVVASRAPRVVEPRLTR